MAVLYTYVGYPLLISVAARRRLALSSAHDAAASPSSGSFTPRTMSVVIAAYNEQSVIADRVSDARAQDYPAGCLDVIVVADGSTDRTAELAAAAGATVLWEPVRRGKSAAVNRGVAASAADLVCLTDANCWFSPGALLALAAPFADPSVAVVSGAKTVHGSSAHGEGEGLYWKLEARLKAAESVFGCTSGAPGEICGLRRSTFRPIPAGVINDDFHLSCDALALGQAVTYAPRAIAREPVSPTLAEEYERRTRISAGTWQTTLTHLRLCDPRGGWIAVSFVSHRVLRSVVVPLLLPVMLVASVLGSKGPGRRVGRLLLSGQLVVYGAAAAGVLGVTRLAAPMQFVLTNLAAVRGGLRFVRRAQPVAWQRARR